ncbi:lysylphosphatidylglycerol synthase domain-containing protein [Phycisphaerales bacterium AB-hyl4]|uniref:Lysylphosphatidylglycerol synthase domain-containing protein n=1 Tax=Natronomicrosphaera hydrolytica TaxID=3242702 RepID=A0ABV4UAP0_9BACT
MPLNRLRQFGRGLGLLLGVALLALAVVYAVRGVDWTVLADAPLSGFVVLAVVVLGNLVLAGLLFWAVTLSFDASPGVGAARMVGLVCVSAVLNYLPLPRAGLVGRSAYLKWRHDLPLRQSAVIVAIVLALAVVVSGIAAGALLVSGVTAGWLALAAAVVVLASVTGAIGRRVLGRAVRHGWLWVPLRTADLLAAALRLWLAFALLGQPIGYEQAVLISAASVLVKLVGLTPSGLGLSEWLIAVLAPVLAPVETATAAAAAVLDRAAEVVVVLIAGGVSMAIMRNELTVGRSQAT